jgi:para-nitrobenzyl esterase
MRRHSTWATGMLMGMTLAAAGTAAAQVQVKTGGGIVEGTTGSDPRIRAFRGIPFAAPPVGDLRWKAPRPAAPWQGVRKATEFGSRCMQGAMFSDMIFRDQPSEDCLYLNVWTPAASPGDRLPVLFWIHGGGFQAGSGSEPRQDGEHLAGKKVVVVNANHRLGVFGFLAHPELTQEWDRRASGNYGLLDMIAALEWVQKNIAAFGGDPKNVTIFGESAGSFAVSALMASPPARGLFQKAIGESGAFFTIGNQGLATRSLTAAEAAGAKFGEGIGAPSLAALRGKPAADVLQAALKQAWFAPIIDGYVLPKEVKDIYAAGDQVHVPLLAGWNADEIRAGVVLSKTKPTAQGFSEQAKSRFGPSADEALKAYPAATDEQAVESAAALASDLFIGYATWKWIEMHATTGGSRTFRYSFDRKIPIAPDTKVNGLPATANDIGARHAGEIEYVFGTLDSVPKVSWQAEDRKLSDVMMSYWTNFARSGDPNGPGLPKWPAYAPKGDSQVMHLDTDVRAGSDPFRSRYEFLDAYASKQR